MKIVCYNVDQRLKYPEYFTKIADLLSRFKADAVILQEAMVWTEVVLLAHAIGMNCSKKAWCAGGHTVLTKAPIEDTWRSLIPRSTWGNGVTGVRVGEVWIFSVHLDDLSYKKDESRRLVETQWILTNLPRHTKAIIAGDFNSPSHLDVDGSVTYPSAQFEKAGWVDVQAGKKWTRSTWMPSRAKTVDRIDRIYIRGLEGIKGGIVDHHDLGLARWPTGNDHRLLWQSLK